jgi:hypothetical protein
MLGLRIGDRGDYYQHDQRYNGDLPLEPGWNSFRISLEEVGTSVKGRRFQLDAISRVLWFVTPQDPPREFWIDNVRLE